MMQQWAISEKVRFESDEINGALAVSPWSGHRQFAYDLVSFIEPQRIVELGTHYGCSFFSFLQACKDKRLDTEVIAIDCWSGDEQAGFYGDEVIQTVKKTVDSFFKGQNGRLVRKFFMDALADVEDGSVDILHIDGLHTYEAVSEDYHSWLCKLKPDGIVLFHDIASELGYGTDKFWEEISGAYPHHYSMPHSWGLGILFPKGERYYHILEKEHMSDKLLAYEYKARYELACLQLADHVKMVQDRDRTIARCEEMIQSRDERIRSDEAMVNKKDHLIAKCEEMIRARDEAIRSNEEMVRARDEAIKSNEEMIRARDEAIRSNEEMIQERDALIRQLQKERERHWRTGFRK